MTFSACKKGSDQFLFHRLDRPSQASQLKGLKKVGQKYYYLLILQGFPDFTFNFHQLGPLGRVGLVVDMSVCLFVSLSPSHAIFFLGLSLVLRLALSSRPRRRARPSAV